ncbi:MAG: hypothetical protein HKN09_02030, partial [Saprospiraceae bacterium]|nr:hypothetical protein [Saprospiraceae bacterium]
MRKLNTLTPNPSVETDNYCCFIPDNFSKLFRLSTMIIFLIVGMMSSLSSQSCCERTVGNTDHCSNSNVYSIYLSSSSGNIHLNGSQLSWIECTDGTATLSGVASGNNGSYSEEISFSFNFGGKTSSPPSGSPNSHSCLNPSTSGWNYYTSYSGTITTLQGGTIYVSDSGPAFQVGNGANVTSSTLDFGASGWFDVTSGGNGFYNNGDINIMLGSTCSSMSLETCYAIAQQSSGKLYEWDVFGNVSFVGTLGVTEVETMSLSGDCNSMYAANGADIGTVNMNTGVFTSCGSLSSGTGSKGTIYFNDVDGMAIDNTTGYIWGVERESGNDLLLVINPSTCDIVEDYFGAGVDYVELSGAFSDVDDLAFNPCTGELYGVSTVSSSSTNDVIVKINQATGSMTIVATLNECDIEGLTFNENCELFGSTGTSACQVDGSLYKIDIASETAVYISSFPYTDVEALVCCVAAPPPPGDVPDEWDFIGCEETECVDIIGSGIKYNLPKTLNIPNAGNVTQIIAEATWDGSNAPSQITFSTSSQSLNVNRIAMDNNGCNPGYYYRALLDPASSVTVSGTNSSNAESFILYVFRDDNQFDGSSCSGSFSHQCIYKATYCEDFNLPTENGPKTIDLTVPLSEITNDGRVAYVTATACGTSETVTINNYNQGNSLNIVEFSLNGVAGNCTTLQLCVESPNTNGQSLYLSGAIKVEQQCQDCDGQITALKIYDAATDAPAPGIPSLTNGTNIPLSNLPDDYYIVAEVNGNYTSVLLDVNGTTQNCENNAPYTFPNGAENDPDGSWNGGVGSYTITADAFSADGCAAGTACETLVVNFDITQDCTDFYVDAGPDVTICEDEMVTLSAMVNGATECDCCVREVSNTDHCNNSNNYVLWLDGVHYTGNNDLTWEECGDGSATLTGTAYNGGTTFEIDITYSGYATTPPSGSPKNNNCTSTNATGWVYYTNMSGTLTSGSTTYTLSRRGPAFQIGDGANITTTGFGASGWFDATNGGTSLNGDINIVLTQSCASGTSCASENIPDMTYIGTYGNSNYYMKTDGDLQYWDAVNFVNARGGNLPKVETQGENDWIANQISGSIWLGLSDQGHQGTWKWYDGEEAIYTNWKSGEPSGNSGEDFARMMANGEWTDREETQYYWVIMEKECNSGGGGGNNNDVSYLWTPGNYTTPSITVSPTNTTTYTVQVTGCDGCTDSDQVTVTVDGGIVCPVDVTINCDQSSDPSNTGYPTITCDPDAILTYEDSDNGMCPLVRTRTWTATVTRIIEDPCVPHEMAHWNFTNAYAKCSNGQEPLDGSGLAPTNTSSMNCNNFNITNVTNQDGSSCVQGAFGSAESAVCVSASPETYFNNNDDDAIMFTIDFGAQDEGMLDKITFYERVDSHNENFGNVDYAQNFGVRVLKDGVEIYKSTGHATSFRDWVQHTFDFSADTDFEYAGATTFKFEILGYNPTSNGHNKKVWEFDELKVFGCCGTMVSNETQEFTCTQMITINDTETPQIFNVPADITVSCQDDVPSVPTDVVASDNCAFYTEFTETTAGNIPCDYTVTRTWTATDDCNNSVSKTQVITVRDDTPPTASVPSSINVECFSDIPNPDTKVITDETDDCDPNPIVSWV